MSENGLYDIDGIWHQPWWQRRECSILMYVLISISIFVGLIMIMRWYSARKKRLSLTCWEEALRDIHTIQSLYSDDLSRDTSFFYVEISKILKKYLHGRYAFAVFNSTDRETVSYLQALDFNKEITGMIAEVFNGGSYVKFAGQKAVKENRERHCSMSIAIIQKTIPTTLK